MTRFFETGFIALVPIPDLKKGRHRAAPPVLVLGSALGSCPHVALSSAQAIVVVALLRQQWQAFDLSASLPSCFSGISPLFSCGF